MDEDSHLDELQKIADCRMMSKTLRRSGGWSIFFGALAILMGFQGLQFNVLNAVLMLIGVAMVVEGLTNVIRPTPLGILTDGFSFLLVAGWNAFIGVLEAMAGVPEAGRTLVLAVVQIGIAIYRFKMYGRIKDAYAIRPTPEHIAAIDRFVSEISKAKADEPGIVQFQTSSFPKAQNWKGKLHGDLAVLVDLQGHDILFAHRDELEITQPKKRMLGKTLHVAFVLKGRTMKGTISPESFEKYSQWKGSVEPQPDA